jgi:hypothetical protein
VLNRVPRLQQPIDGVYDRQCLREVDHIRDLVDIVHGHGNAYGEDGRETMITPSEHLLVLIVSDSGSSVEHEADQGLYPQRVALVMLVTLDVLQAHTCSKGQQQDVIERWCRIVTGILYLGEGAHGRVARVNSADDVAVG